MMTKPRFQARSTRIAGTTVFAVLRVDRRAYEFARMWAENHSGPGLSVTAEEQLEGHLNAAMADAMEGWECPPDIDALYPPPAAAAPSPRGDQDDDLPF